MRKVLVFADYFEPGYKAGGPIRTLKNIFKAFGTEYDFYLITRDHDCQDLTPYNVRKLEWIKREFYSVFYVPENALGLRTIKEQIRKINPDIIYCNSFFSANLSIKVVWGNKNLRKKIILNPRGELSEGSLRQKWVKKHFYLAICSLFKPYREVTFHASGSVETSAIQSLVKCKDIVVAPDLVGASTMSVKTGYHKEKGKLKLCFISRVDHEKNLVYAINCIGQLNNPNISMDIFGPIEDQRYWGRCKEMIANYDVANTVKYKGILKPEDVSATFRKYDFFFFPTYGESFGHVIFESLSVGTPLIMSNTTFWNKYLDREGWSFIFALQDKDLLLNSLQKFCEMNDLEYQCMSQKALDIASEYADSSTLKSQTSLVFESV